MRALMVQGVSSGAGKSLVVTALCRWLHRRGVKVAPFKAQNMSNNARVANGGEMGSAQWFQAMAAGVVPDVRMNPVLLKPESDTRAQVVVNGAVDHDLTNLPWRGRTQRLWPAVDAAFRSLAADFEVIVIEGAGSPAETNLWADDIVNMRVAELAGAPVLLVADIDRGGAFAHLYGTWALLPPPWQARIEGFLLNKFRGDASLLAPAPDDLAAATGIPMVGVLPMLRHALPDEEGPSTAIDPPARPWRRSVQVLCGPYASNLDEFVALQRRARVEFVDRRQTLTGADLVVLPGSKHVAADRQWLRATRLDDEVRTAAGAGVGVLGICGGLQLLGHVVAGAEGIEGSADGLGLLDVDTRYGRSKLTSPTTTTFSPLPPPWTWLSSRTVSGYEIRFGETTARPGGNASAALPGGAGFVAGNVLGVSLHGLFEDEAVRAAFTGDAGTGGLDTVFDQLADAVDEHLNNEWLLTRT